ncbi:DUF937 domain-containing protein [Lichenicola cladoniae]|uniref:DUF937 domain-containing protein n=1 Tax=Lichenicola cladoniae TaxID=1484109 RepID=A0A6M8HJ53_9PROT|nr:YidB family protein [Lichenicola cladoniae]NPD69641.1 DUF937 domain-containing protein [Acetobacteraceae bacterium]QKE88708.1 DUF937 domain-containing protein [Lichenicola cladoniae]
MSGFLSGLKAKAMALAGGEDAIAGLLAKMLESQGGQAGVAHIVKQFDNVGLGDKARSWTGNGPPQPLTTEEVQRVLTSDQVKFLASCTGLPLAPLLPVIAKLLPIAISKMAKQQEGPQQAAHEAVEQVKDT